MDTSSAAVYDDVISKRLEKQIDQELRNLFVNTKRVVSEKAKMHQATVYSDWCAWCSQKARNLNSSNLLSSTWLDWDGSEHSWRAVDVERAFFALGRQ